MDHLLENDLQKLLGFANVEASIITTRRGALKVMQTAEEIRRLMKEYQPGYA